MLEGGNPSGRGAQGAAGSPIHNPFVASYPLLFLVLFIESIGIPSPSELSLVYVGVLAGEGKVSLPLVIIVAALGSVAGANVSYWIAARGGRHLVVKYGKRVGLTDERLQVAEKFFHGRGDVAVLVGRLISGVRAIISYPAGLFGMPYPRFLVFTSIGALIWPILAAGAGYLVGPRWKELAVWLSRFWIAILGLALIALVSYMVVVRRRRRGKEKTGV